MNQVEFDIYSYGILLELNIQLDRERERSYYHFLYLV